MWCAIADARGEKIVTSVPRSLWNLSCGCTASRSWSSVIVSGRLASAAPDLEAGNLFVAERLQFLRRGREVTVAVDRS
jgi:hypothetical protein